MPYTPTAARLVLPSEPFFFDVGSLYGYLERLSDHRDPRGLLYPLPVANEIRYGITGLSRQAADAEELLKVVRQHSEVENGLPYRRDRR
jgi:hypothetical protein